MSDQPAQPLTPAAADTRDAWQKLALVLAVAGVMTWLVLRHFDGVNGSLYHVWAWRRIPWWRIGPPMVLAAVPFVAAQIVWQRGLRGLALVSLMCSMMALQVVGAAVQVDPFSVQRLAEVVEHPTASSYYSVAYYLATQREFGDFLAEYPSQMFNFWLHARQKPPGMILFYYALLKLWSQHASLVGGLILGLLTSLCAPAVYLLGRQFTRDRDAAFAAASYLSLSPGILLFFPMFDACYPLLTCALLGCWAAAMSSGRIVWGLATGAVLSFTLFLTYNLLVLGAFMVLLSAWHMRREGTPALRRFVVMSCATLAALTITYSLMYLFTGFDAVATFRAALRNQRWMDENFFVLPRPWPHTIPGDLYDFILGSGWVSLVLVSFWLRRGARSDSNSPLLMLGLVQILIVAVSGLLRAETARVWLFLLPLLVLPIGSELSRWPTATRMVVYFCLWWFVVLIDQNMKFLLW